MGKMKSKTSYWKNLSLFNLPQYLKKGGSLAVWLYSNQNPCVMNSTKFWRFFATKIPKRLFYAFCYLAIPLYYIKKIPVIGHILKLTVPTSMSKKWDWIVLETFDWYTPTFMTFHSYRETFEWFTKANFQVMHVGEPTAVSGVKL